MNYVLNQVGSQTFSAPMPQATVEPLLVDLLQRAEQQREALGDLLTRVVTLADRVVGSAPKQDAAPPAPAPVPNGLIERLQMEQSGLNYVIDALNQHLSRLERIG